MFESTRFLLFLSAALLLAIAPVLECCTFWPAALAGESAKACCRHWAHFSAAWSMCSRRRWGCQLFWRNRQSHSQL